jgi:staphylococcal nuclease domain-containing protein 1
MAAEARAIADGKGIHSGKDFPAARIVDASESAAKAATFLGSFKRQGRIPAVVDFVASGSRFKVRLPFLPSPSALPLSSRSLAQILLPKLDTKLTFVLSSIRAPRTARNANEKSEPYGTEAHTYTARRLLQRDVEIQVDATDKSGGFIGRVRSSFPFLLSPSIPLPPHLEKIVLTFHRFVNPFQLFYNGQDVAALLVRDGLAKVDDYYQGKELWSLQEEAQKAKRNIWTNYDPSQEAESALNGVPTLGAVVGSNGAAAAQPRKEYVDVVVSEVRGGTETVPFSFSVQLLKDGGIPELEKVRFPLSFLFSY